MIKIFLHESNYIYIYVCTFFFAYPLSNLIIKIINVKVNTVCLTVFPSFLCAVCIALFMHFPLDLRFSFHLKIYK